jgi:broad-specificity NMP kinase
MGKRNYLIEGVSGTGKTSVAEELQRRGHHVIHGDRELLTVVKVAKHFQSPTSLQRRKIE